MVATERAPVLLPVAKADDVLLPAHSAIVAESTELRKINGSSQSVAALGNVRTA